MSEIVVYSDWVSANTVRADGKNGYEKAVLNVFDLKGINLPGSYMIRITVMVKVNGEGAHEDTINYVMTEYFAWNAVRDAVELFWSILVMRYPALARAYNNRQHRSRRQMEEVAMQLVTFVQTIEVEE